jgi:hypothetical protein
MKEGKKEESLLSQLPATFTGPSDTAKKKEGEQNRPGRRGTSSIRPY